MLLGHTYIQTTTARRRAAPAIPRDCHVSCRTPSNNLRRPTVALRPGLLSRCGVCQSVSCICSGLQCGMASQGGSAWPVPRTVEPFDLKAAEAVATAMRQEVDGCRSRNGHTPSTCAVPRRAAPPPPGWLQRAPPPMNPSKPSCKVAEIWARARRNLESKFTVAWAKQLAAMALCDTAGRPDVKKAVLLKAHAERMIRQANKAIATVVRRENDDAVTCDGLQFATSAVEALVRVEDGLEVSPVAQQLCERVRAVAGQGGLDATRDPAEAPAVEALALEPPSERSEATPAPAATDLEHSDEGEPGPTPELGSASPDGVEELVGLLAPGPGGAATQPSSAATGRRKPRKRKRSGRNSRSVQREKRRAARATAA